jgi:PAS domain S-box-containing protein
MPNQTILIVEDETITALDIEQSLRASGYKVAGMACTGPEAIAMADQKTPDLVLMDIRLKGSMDGIEAATQIRSKLNIPIVFLTAYADRPTLQRAKSAEPFAYLLKPFEEAVLCTTIEIALHKHRAHELLVQQTAEALQLSQTRFDQLVENVPDYAVVLLDPEGRIQSWNPGAERLHGWSPEEALGKDLEMLFPADEVAQKKPELELEKAQRSGQYAEYGSLIRKNSARVEVQTLLICLKNPNGKSSGFLWIARELSPSGTHN